MASKAHGKTIVYVEQDTKGKLIQLIHELHQRPDIQLFLKQNNQHFLTYDQAIDWLLTHRMRIED